MRSFYSKIAENRANMHENHGPTPVETVDWP